ncbi:hypothetical protein FRC09_013779 [Ceratobasidium sp. 395]|nr:hypothetical protein FRC09_013779 [Ceratobasidium sp. 395]
MDFSAISVNTLTDEEAKAAKNTHRDNYMKLLAESQPVKPLCERKENVPNKSVRSQSPPTNALSSASTNPPEETIQSSFTPYGDQSGDHSNNPDAQCSLNQNNPECPLTLLASTASNTLLNTPSPLTQITSAASTRLSEDTSSDLHEASKQLLARVDNPFGAASADKSSLRLYPVLQPNGSQPLPQASNSPTSPPCIPHYPAYINQSDPTPCAALQPELDPTPFNFVNTSFNSFGEGTSNSAYHATATTHHTYNQRYHSYNRPEPTPMLSYPDAPYSVYSGDLASVFS